MNLRHQALGMMKRVGAPVVSPDGRLVTLTTLAHAMQNEGVGIREDP